MLSFVNPFVPLDVENPSYAQKLQKPLKVTIFFTFKYDILFDKKYINITQGVTREDFQILQEAMKTFEPMIRGEVDCFDDGMQPLLKLMSREIIKQKKRLGGDFAVAHAVVSR